MTRDEFLTLHPTASRLLSIVGSDDTAPRRILLSELWIAKAAHDREVFIGPTAALPVATCGAWGFRLTVDQARALSAALATFIEAAAVGPADDADKGGRKE